MYNPSVLIGYQLEKEEMMSHTSRSVSIGYRQCLGVADWSSAKESRNVLSFDCTVKKRRWDYWVGQQEEVCCHWSVSQHEWQRSSPFSY